MQRKNNSFRHGLLLNYNGFNHWIDPYCSEIFLHILLTDLQSSAFLQHVPTWPVTVSAGCIAQGRGQQLRAGQPGQILLSRSSTGLVLIYKHEKFGCEVLFLVLIYSSFKSRRVCKQLGSCRYIFCRFRAFAEAPSHTHLHYSCTHKKHIYH